jgi:DNA-binding GntR family transcriptional regulator
VTNARARELKKVLEQDIATGALAPGTRLDELSLAGRFRVSRTPVREALRELAAIGLVEIRPRRGAVVAAVGLKDLLDMFEVMAELEGMCGRLAARRCTAEELAVLCRIHEHSRRWVERDDPDAYYTANLDFHQAIYCGSHNHCLANQTKLLRNRLNPYRRLQLRRAGRLVSSFDEHGAIMAAIAARDSARAEQLLRVHVTVQGGSFNDFVASLPSGLLRAELPVEVPSA